MSSAPKYPQKPAIPFAEPASRRWLAIVLFWSFVLCGIGVFIWLITLDTGQKPLVCDEGPHSLLSFGRCSDQSNE